jgi:hypothetical protein
MTAAPAEEAPTWRLALRENGVVIEELEGRYLVVRLEDGVCFEMNTTGMFLWRCLVGGACAQGELSARLARATGEDVTRVEPDVASFVARLAALGLVERAVSA